MSELNKYKAHFKYTMTHKWYVFLECCKFGIPFRGIMHDMSKFTRKEFGPYARYFFDDNGKKKEISLKNGGDYTKANDSELEEAAFWHQKRNPHHWQYWVMVGDDGSLKPIEMPWVYTWEMLADWAGAARAKGTGTALDWYTKMKDKMILHEDTRKMVETFLGYKD